MIRGRNENGFPPTANVGLNRSNRVAWSAVLCLAALGFSWSSPVAAPCPGPCVAFGPAPRIYRVDPWAQDLAIADLNGDGLLDVVTANIDSNTLSILLGNAERGFEPFRRIEVPPNRTVPSSSQPCGVIVADFDRDGRSDLAVVYRALETVSIYRGNGDGSFQAPINFPIHPGGDSGVSRATVQLALVSADFDADGYTDVAVVSVPEVLNENDLTFVSVLRNNRAGGFFPETDYRLPNDILFVGGAYGATLIAEDVDRDGRVDLVLTHLLSSKLWFLGGLGGGRFADPIASVAYPSETPFPPRASGLALGDVDGDGRVDAAVTFQDSGFVAVLRGDGSGRFFADISHAPLTAAPGSAGGNHVALADLDRDGKLDIIATNRTTIGILYGKGNGDFEPSQEFPSGSSGRAVRVADFNHDGYPEIVICTPTESIDFYSLDQGRPPARPLRLPLSSLSFILRVPPIVSVDLNGDGLKDFVSGDGSVWLQTGREHFVQKASFLPPGFISDNVLSVVAADFNGDGKPDLVFVTRVPGLLWLALGRGDGTFAAPRQFDFPRLYPLDQARMVAADVDGDGNLDLITPNGVFNEVLVMRGDGRGGLQDPIISPVGAPLGAAYTPIAAAIADFNGDGKPDLAVVEKTYPLVTILTGTGDGRFTAPVQYDLGTGDSFPNAIAVADFDRDGHLDLAIAVAGSYSVVLRGKADDTFGSPDYFYTGRVSTDVVAADLNGDGNPDLLFVSAGDLTVLMGDGRGGFDANTVFAVDSYSQQLELLDFDGDGRLDVAVSTCSNFDLAPPCAISLLNNETFGPARQILHPPRARPNPRRLPRR